MPALDLRHHCDANVRQNRGIPRRSGRPQGQASRQWRDGLARGGPACGECSQRSESGKRVRLRSQAFINNHATRLARRPLTDPWWTPVVRPKWRPICPPALRQLLYRRRPDGTLSAAMDPTERALGASSLEPRLRYVPRPTELSASAAASPMSGGLSNSAGMRVSRRVRQPSR